MFFFQIIKTRLKIIFNRYNLITICLFIIGFNLFHSFYTTNEKGFKVGFISNSSFSDNIINQYEFYNGNIINVEKYENEIDMIKDVVSGNIDTGYVLPTDFVTTKDAFIEYNTNKSMLGSFNKFFLNTIYLQNFAGSFGKNILTKVTPLDALSITSINDINNNYLKEAPFMTYNYNSNNSFSGENLDKTFVDKIYYQIASLVILISLMILLYIDNESFSKNHLHRLLFNKNKLMFLFGNFLAYNLYVLLLLILLIDIPFVLLILTTYLITLFGFTMRNFIKNKSYFIIFIIFYFLLSIILGEIFISISFIFKNNIFFKYFFITYYLGEIFNYNFLSYFIFTLMLSTLYLWFVLFKLKNNFIFNWTNK